MTTQLYFFLSIIVCVCAESCPAFCNPADCSLLGSSVHGIFQARILDWVAISYSRISSQPRDQMIITNSREWCKQVGQWTYWCLSGTIQRRYHCLLYTMVLVACILVYIIGWVPWEKNSEMKRSKQEHSRIRTGQRERLNCDASQQRSQPTLWRVLNLAWFLRVSWGEPGTRSIHFNVNQLSDPSHPRKEVWPWVRQLSSAEAGLHRCPRAEGFCFQHSQRLEVSLAFLWGSG